MNTSSLPALANRIDHAMARAPADLVIKNVTVFDVVSGTLTESDIAITDGTIVGTYGVYNGRKEIDGRGLTAVPGFIDTHVHVESSMVTPHEFDRCVLPHGTTTAICDPHEMANVLGSAALKYFQESAEHTVMDLMVQLSSCVPATPLETSGATLDAKALLRLRHHPKTIGLAEFMDIGGVLGKNPDTLEKLIAFHDGHIDGHLPGISGYALNAMASCGIRTCHETTELRQGIEKLQKGIQVLIREGTVCKDLHALVSLIDARQSPFLGFCTDDRNPLEIAREGHIDYLVRKAILLGADPRDVYRVAGWSAAQGFGLDKDTPKWQKRGMIAPGWKADLILLSDFETCAIHSVIKSGRVVTSALFDARPEIKSPGRNSVKLREIVPADFAVAAGTSPQPQHVIGLIKDQVVTEHLRYNLPIVDDRIVSDPENDLLKIAVLERHGRNGNIAIGFVQGFGFKEGAIASSVGHDSHNITVVGAGDEDMALAVNRIRKMQGGYAVVKNGKLLGDIPLPIAGLMSDRPFEIVQAQQQRLKAASKLLGSRLDDPMMMLAFLPLCVIGKLKITDFGPVRFDPANGDQAPVLIDDQRGRYGSVLPLGKRRLIPGIPAVS